MVKCFVEGCRSYNRQTARKVHFFRLQSMTQTPDPDVVRKWRDALSRSRIFNENYQNHRVCERHFRPECIIKEEHFFINGERVALPLARWKLAKDAVPTVFPDSPKNYKRKVMPICSPSDSEDAPEDSKHEQKRRKQVNVSVSRQICISKKPARVKEEFPPSDSDSLNIDLLETRWYQEDRRQSPWRFKMLRENGNLIACFVNLVSEGKAVISKQIRIFQTLQFQVFFLDTDVTTFFIQEHQLALHSMTDVENLLETASKKMLCQGLDGFTKIGTCDAGHRVGDKWFSRSCDVVGNCKVCCPCKVFYLSLMQKLSRMKCT